MVLHVRHEFRLIPGVSAGVLRAHGSDLHIGPVLEPLQVALRHAQQFGDDDHRQRKGEVVMQIEIAVAGQGGIDELASQCFDLRAQRLDGARREPVLQQPAEIGVLRRIAQHTLGLGEAGSLSVLAGEGVDVAQCRLYIGKA